ncbi:MAG: hemolysin family protein [Candidatus Omnitrophota bacterium]
MNPMLWKGIVLLFLLGLSGLFSASEMALFSLSRIQLKRLGDFHRRGHRVILSLLNRPRRTLTTILIGNTLVNVAASALGTSLAIHLLGNAGWGVAVGSMTFLILILGEINPKTIALRNTERVSLFVAPFISFFAYLILPIRRLTRAITDFILDLLTGESTTAEPYISSHELKTLVSIGESEGILDRGERNMLQAVFEFGEIRVGEIMTPRVDIVGCPLGSSSSEVKKILQRAHRSMVSVYEGSLDNIKGVLSAKDFLLSRQTENWRKLIRPVFYVPEFKKIGDLLLEFQKKQESLAIVIDEYGGTAGLVTLEDILEEIVGEIQNEYDGEELHFQWMDQKTLRVDGKASMRELAEMMDMNLLEEEKRKNVAGFLLSKLGRIPNVGDVFVEVEMHFKVEEMKQNRIRRLLVWRAS